jgi:hypothetical protein
MRGFNIKPMMYRIAGHASRTIFQATAQIQSLELYVSNHPVSATLHTGYATNKLFNLSQIKRPPQLLLGLRIV